MNQILDRLEKIKDLKISQEHSGSDSLYGHMSKVRSLNDFLKFPNLKKTNPQKFYLKAGDCLVIPKGWWHHVTSNENTYGCNFWTSEKLSDIPVLLKHDINFGFDDIKDDEIYVWSSDKIYHDNEIENIKPIKFKNFIESKNQNEYFWTLKNYNILNKNNNICEKILNKIKIPEIIKNTNQNFEFNIMACSKKHVTHLHYDDEDGLLCVTGGVKEIVMFPPTDTVNLYPVKFKKYKWKDSPAIDCCYNLYQKKNKIEGMSSSKLLYETCKNNVGVLSSISKIIKHFHGDEYENKTIWAVKKQNGIDEYSWELYKLFNYEHKNSEIISYEIYPKRIEHMVYFSNFYDEYHILKQDNSFFQGKIYRNQDNIKNFRGDWILDSQDSFFKKYDEYLKELNFSKNIFNIDILKKYNCTYNCIHQKYNNEFYIQYIGISREDFINFLIEQNYDLNLINHYKNKNYKISNEITIVYDENLNVKRSAFYGIV